MKYTTQFNLIVTMKSRGIPSYPTKSEKFIRPMISAANPISIASKSVTKRFFLKSTPGVV